MFCPCFFQSKPAAHTHGNHTAEHYCRFNIAYKVNRGTHGGVRLDGMKFWIAGDLGADLLEGSAEWAVLTFEPSATKAQREGIMTILGRIYPFKWKSFSTAPDAAIAWSTAKDSASAKLGRGEAAEIVLRRQPGNTADPVVIHNLKYQAAPRNGGIILMPNDIQAYRTGSRRFESRGTTGYMVTVDINSADRK